MIKKKRCISGQDPVMVNSLNCINELSYGPLITKKKIEFIPLIVKCFLSIWWTLKMTTWAHLTNKFIWGFLSLKKPEMFSALPLMDGWLAH